MLKPLKSDEAVDGVLCLRLAFVFSYGMLYSKNAYQRELLHVYSVMSVKTYYINCFKT